MMYEVTIKEMGRDALLHPTYDGDVSREFLVRFFGLDSPDVEWYEIRSCCCICGKPIEGHGNNAAPVKDGLCCEECNATKVIPERIKMAKGHASKD